MILSIFPTGIAFLVTALRLMGKFHHQGPGPLAFPERAKIKCALFAGVVDI